MTAGSSTLSLQFNVSTILVDKIPTPKTAWNQFDEAGLIQSLSRNREETNWEYRRRLRDVFAHIGNSSYLGMVNGVTRELGLSIFDAIAINPKETSAGFTAAEPVVIFDGAFLYLYANYSEDALELKINRNTKGGNFEVMQDLVDLINSTSSYFYASLVSGVDQRTKSMCIYNQTNRLYVANEAIDPSTKFRLKKEKLISGTLFFSDRTTFFNEVSTETSVVKKGDYYVDYWNGIVTVYQLPTVGTTARYYYIDYPFVAHASPVIIGDITSTAFNSEMFIQILQDDGTYENGRPNAFGVELINELLSVGGGLYWGA